VRRYPSNGVSDDALWNGAATARLAWEQFKQPADLATATRLLKWLRREYPSSKWVAQAATQLTALSQTAKPAPTKASATGPTALASATAVPPAPPSATATVRSITKSELPRGERLTIELDREVIVTPERIANPERVFFDLRNTQFDPALAATLEGVNGPRIANVRIGRQDAHTTRVVLSLAGAPRHSVFTLYHPYRLVVDLEADALPPLTPSTESMEPEAAAPPPPVVTHPAIDHRPIQSIPATSTPVAPVVVKPEISLGLPPAPPAATSRGDYSLARQLGLRN
jgi:N-acetylmuramoyl-L-alanine amidase